MIIPTLKIRDLLFVIMGLLVLTGTIANGLLLLTVWEQYQSASSDAALYKLIGSLALAGISTLIVIAAILLVINSFSKPLKILTDLMIKLSNQDLSIQIPYQNKNNEFGDMARTLAMFRDKLIENQRLIEEQLREDQQKLERAQLVEQSVSDFDRHAQSFIGGLQSSMGNLTRTSQELGEVATTGLQSAQGLQSISGQASENTGMVYQSAQEMLQSIAQVSQQISQSTRVSHEATDKAQQASQSIAELQDAALKIGDIITLIDDIAKETNMLALNATIEAARAGEAGKGFAVVANEVKTLATQTSDATDEIRQQVESVQESIGGTVDLINEIGAVIANMNDMLGLVSSSMDQQNNTSQTIAGNAQDAVTASKEVLQTSDHVYSSAEKTEKSAEILTEVSGELLTKTDQLYQEMKAFFDKIKA